MGCCKTPKCTFSANLVKVVVADRQKKLLESRTTPEIRGFCPLGPPPNKVSTFLIIIAKIRSSQTFFMYKVFFQRVWFRLFSLLSGRSQVL